MLGSHFVASRGVAAIRGELLGAWLLGYEEQNASFDADYERAELTGDWS